jgi:hypothetical protein
MPALGTHQTDLDGHIELTHIHHLGISRKGFTTQRGIALTSAGDSVLIARRRGGNRDWRVVKVLRAMCPVTNHFRMSSARTAEEFNYWRRLR